MDMNPSGTRQPRVSRTDYEVDQGIDSFIGADQFKSCLRHHGFAQFNRVMLLRCIRNGLHALDLGYRNVAASWASLRIA